MLIPVPWERSGGDDMLELSAPQTAKGSVFDQQSARMRTWTRWVILSVVCIVGIVVGLNIVIDANGVLRTDLTRQFQPPNMSFAKIERIRRDTSAFDSFLFGSSRVGAINAGHIPGGRYYNLFYAAGLPEEHLQHLRYLLRVGVPVKNVMVGLDEFSGLFDPADHDADLDLQVHPAVSGKSLVTFYAQHFFKLNRLVPQLQAYVRYNYTHRVPADQRRIIYDLERTGNLFCPRCDDDVEQDLSAHVKSSKFLQPWEYRFVEGDHIEAAISAIRSMADLARSRGFRLIVFINPIHRTTYLNTDLRKFARFKQELAAITDYYDFSGLNSITTNNYYFYETSHYRPLVGDMMLRVMLGAPQVHVPRDFGFLVTSQNVAAHLREQCLEVKASQGGPGRGAACLQGPC